MLLQQIIQIIKVLFGENLWVGKSREFCTPSAPAQTLINHSSWVLELDKIARDGILMKIRGGFRGGQGWFAAGVGKGGQRPLSVCSCPP